MFDGFKKMFSNEVLPASVYTVDEPMLKFVSAAAPIFEMQAMMGGLDEDPANWIRDERAVVLGYIDGTLALMYEEGDPRAELATLKCAELVFKGKRTFEQLMDERTYLVTVQDKRFFARRRRRFSGFKEADERSEATSLHGPR